MAGRRAVGTAAPRLIALKLQFWWRPADPCALGALGHPLVLRIGGKRTGLLHVR